MTALCTDSGQSCEALGSKTNNEVQTIDVMLLHCDFLLSKSTLNFNLLQCDNNIFVETDYKMR